MTLPDTQILSVYWSAEALSVNTILVLHLVGSMLLGMMVGYERSYQGRAAGMRTYALVCMASTAAVALSGYPEVWFGGHPVAKAIADPTRTIQGIVTGIGFLGAGVIIKEGHSISGLSTAASIWASAVIGILVGVGFYVAAIALALLCAFSMSIIVHLEKKLPQKKKFLFELQFHSGIEPNESDLRALAKTNGFIMGKDGITITLRKGRQSWSYIASSLPRQTVNMTQLALALESFEGLASFNISPTRN